MHTHTMRLYLVHHGDAVSADLDPRRPLSSDGRLSSERLAELVATRGVRPGVIWHSGKLRARQTAECFWRACNPLAEFVAVPGLQPTDYPGLFRDQLIGEPRDIMGVGHMPNLARVLAMLTTGNGEESAPFPAHGIVALERAREEETWIEQWRLDAQTQ